MSNYRRCYQDGGCYFFTVVTHHRQPLLASPKIIDRLRQGFRHIRQKHPFEIDAIVVLPDHLHSIWRLPENDRNFSTRWRLLKYYVSTADDRKIWQPRFWEHLIRDEQDWQRHMDYIHYNPVKHGLVNMPADWEFSSFHRALRQGFYLAEWGAVEPDSIVDMVLE
ncbi:MAG: transposase [gamma proteobacterium endosymbiont of Lamellibrachia anaximandri]|nr:transposase [gamma proteobacterium endosymbiont of Lamellibrachia anaximandri]